MRASALKLSAQNPPPRPLAERGVMLFVKDVQQLIGKDESGEWRRSEWWIRVNFAPEFRRYLGRTPYWWTCDAIAWLEQAHPAAPSTTLYFLRNPLTGLIKIGVASDVEQRVRTLECAGGMALEVMGVGADLGRYEKALHGAFAGDRQIGEWFAPSPALLALAASPTREAIGAALSAAKAPGVA